MSPARELARVAISGYYGCGNSGDEAVLMGIRDAFRKCAGGNVVLTALSQRPEETTARHGISAANRMDMTALKATIRQSDLLISGGGSLLQDTTSFKSLLYYLYVMRVAKAAKVPFMLYAQGIGPLRRPISKLVTQMVVNDAARITVRDVGSQALLKSIGVTKPAIEVTADPAFALMSASETTVAAELSKSCISAGERVIGISLRPWSDNAPTTIERYRGLIAEIEATSGIPCVLLPMHHPDDLEFARRVTEGQPSSAKTRILESKLPPDVVLGLVSQFSAVVAMRLHTLIFAARSAVVPFALSYDPKVNQLMTGLGLKENCFDWREFDGSAIASQVADSLRSSEKWTRRLLDKKAEREVAALRNCEAALEVLNGSIHRN